MTIKSEIIQGATNRPTLLDAYWKADGKPKPIVIFSHGYKGYKDWGAWALVAEAFAQAGFIFVKFNFSHNGGTIENPIDFPDLDAFGENNYSKEIEDLGYIIDWCQQSDAIPNKEKDLSRINLIGHSRGGGITVLKASQDTRVSRIVTWAAVSDYAIRFPKGEAFTRWKKDGVYYVINGRTKQEMPHFFQYYENFKENEDQLNIKKAANKITQPFLVIHGVDDRAVSLDEAKALQEWSSNSQLILIENTGHTFGTKHPYEEVTLPSAMQTVVEKSIAFLQ